MSFPVTANLEGDLRVEIHLHSFFLGDRDRQCWTYITRGFRGQQQREMSLSLLVEDDDDTLNFPKTPVKMFQLLAERTQGDRKLHPGDAMLLGQRGIFGFPSLFCLPAIQFDELPSLDEHLALVLVHAEEYEYARQHGLTRLLSRLGKFCSSFPYPTWNTRARPTLFPGESPEISLLKDASHVDAGRSFAQQHGQELTLALHRDNLATLLDAYAHTEEGQVLTACTGFSPECDASLYWQPGQPDVGAYASESRRSGIIGGSFVMISQAEDAYFAVIEDGFELNLTARLWRELGRSLDDPNELQCSLGNGQRLHVTFMTEEGALLARPYEPRATWRRLSSPAPAQPQERAPTTTGQVMLGPVANLLGNNTLEDNVSKTELAGYLTQVEHMLAQALSEETMQFHFNLDILIDSNGADPTLSSDMALNPEFVTFIENLVGRILPCEVGSPIHIRLPFRVNEQT